MKIFSSIAVICVAIVLFFAGCNKNEINYGVYSKLAPEKTLLKVNYNIALTANPAVQIKVNGERVSLLIQSRYPYPGGGYNTLGDSRADYLGVDAGNTVVSISIPKKGTNIDSVELYKVTVPTVAGKNYTLHITDTATNTKSLVTEDLQVQPDSGFFKFRFVNLMPTNAALDLYNGSTLVMANISYLAASDYVTLPISTPTSSTWTVRVAGSAATSTAVATYTSANTILNRKVYTVFATGYTGRTDAVRKPYLSFFLTK